MKGKRIAWLSDWGGAYQIESGILPLCEAALQVFTDQGAVVDLIAPPFPAHQLWQSWTVLRAMMNAGGFKTLYDNHPHALKPETVWEIEKGRALSVAEVYDASVIRSRWYAHAAALFDTYDALVLPSAQVWPFPIEWRWPQSINGHAMDTYHRWMEVVIPASLIGLPALNVPVGFGTQGLPMGMQIIGRAGADADILALGQAYHLATDWPARGILSGIDNFAPA